MMRLAWCHDMTANAAWLPPFILQMDEVVLDMSISAVGLSEDGNCHHLATHIMVVPACHASLLPVAFLLHLYSVSWLLLYNPAPGMVTGGQAET